MRPLSLQLSPQAADAEEEQISFSNPVRSRLALGRWTVTLAVAAIFLGPFPQLASGQTEEQVAEYHRVRKADFKTSWAFLQRHHPEVDLRRMRLMPSFVRNLDPANEPHQGKYVYAYQTSILAAAKADPATDSDEQIAAKIAAMWKIAEAYGFTGTKYTIVDTGMISILKVAAESNIGPFLNDAIAWGIDLNAVDEYDNQTVLDFLQVRIDRGDQRPYVRQNYERLRKAGAKHKSELIASGERGTDEAVQAARIARLRDEAEAGDVLAMFTLSKIHLQGHDMPVNVEEGMRWWNLACQRSIEVKDYRKILSVGFSYYPDDDYDNSKSTDDLWWISRYDECLNRSVGANGDKACKWFQIAADAGDEDGIYWTARCLIKGIGVRRNQEDGIARLVPLALTHHQLARKLIAVTYLEMKDMKNFAMWMRVMPDYQSVDGMLVADWFALKRIPLKGPTPPGWKE